MNLLHILISLVCIQSFYQHVNLQLINISKNVNGWLVVKEIEELYLTAVKLYFVI